VFVAETAAQPPEAAIVFVTVYVPGMLVARFISPVEVLTNVSPTVEEKTPGTPPPLKVGDGFGSSEQNGVPG
jgi:hypothetical protein